MHTRSNFAGHKIKFQQQGNFIFNLISIFGLREFDCIIIYDHAILFSVSFYLFVPMKYCLGTFCVS